MLICLQFGAAHAQWAVYDDMVYQQLLKLNKTRNISGFDSTQRTYDHYESERAESGDVRMGRGDGLAVLKSLQTKFEDADALPELTDEEKIKYVGTVADCGQKETNPMHYNACIGLRNLRLQTLVQSHAMLKNLAMRREQIVSLIKKTRSFNQKEGESELGQIQRATFEIQGQQALMQADALQIKILMDGYKQREVMYITQQDEARKSALVFI
jgi:hypothetical protein